MFSTTDIYKGRFMEKITSCQNIKVKSAVSLKSAKNRHEYRKFLAEGIKLIRELIPAGFNICMCFVSEKADLSLLPSGIDRECVIISSENVMEKISSLTTPQDFIAVCDMKKDCHSDSDSYGDFILALDRLQDPANIGAVMRSAEAFGVKDIVLSRDCCDIYSPKVLRAAMGSAFRINAKTADLAKFLSEKRGQGYDIIGAGLDKSFKTVDKLHESKRKVLIIGNEGNGISKEICKICSFGIYIPMYGQNESLNAAVAASIIMWENIRQNNE